MLALCCPQRGIAICILKVEIGWSWLLSMLVLTVFASALEGTNRYFNKVVARQGITSTFVDCSNIENVRAAITPNTKVYQRSLSVLTS